MTQKETGIVLKSAIYVATSHLTTDLKNPLKLFYDYSDFSIPCSKIATKSLQYALQKGCHR